MAGLCEGGNEPPESLKSIIRALPGRSQNGTHCRHCRSEKETLAHILGACPHGELLRNSRHHKIRSLLASALRGKDYQVEEEVHGLSTNGSTRRIDIIAIPTRSTSGFIIDPTRNPITQTSYNGWGAHRANHTIPPFWLDDRPPLLRHVAVSPAAGWSVLALRGL
ncbi:hypothetical protein ANN_12547 [Periplaneta americana]|uniref:Reverse transcriptase n=1 Tax=Periplaneta americana TaxID=6978 RepID=A0ABQ8TJD6_PERAM|nr:hypothetical protein ANN_12547 [Periplaneta americana]